MSRYIFQETMLKVLILAYFVVGLNADPVSWKTLGIDINANWGPEGREDDVTIRPYKIKFDEETKADLLYRLKNHRPLTPPLENTTYEYGANTYDLKKWIDYWANNYNFDEREKFLNTENHYITDIQGVPIHYIKRDPQGDITGKVVLPVLLMHGWPGSVREFYSTLPNMTTVSDDRDFVLQVIAPSLPGFGFSGIADRSGMGAVEIAVMMRNLMLRNGFDKYLVVGGDWGSIIGYILCTLFPEEPIGYISNMGLALTEEAIGFIATAASNPSMLVTASEANRIYPLWDTFSFFMQEFGYFHMQATKPYTLGVGLTDSPSGWLAWMLQHIGVGTNKNSMSQPDGGLSVYTKEELLDNAMFYWPDRVTSSSLIYANTANLKNWNEGISALQTTTPTYVIQAKHEVFYTPIKSLKSKYTNLVNVKVLNEGGHFLAMEKPEFYSELVFEAVADILCYREIKNM